MDSVIIIRKDSDSQKNISKLVRIMSSSKGLRVISISSQDKAMSLPQALLPLDDEYNISSEESTSLKRVIGIQDDNELKQHLLSVRTEAYAVGFGSDSRIIIADGYPLENVITSDLYSDYWTIGHKLFKTTPETFPVPFLQGDIFDPNFLQPGVPALDTSSQIIDSPPSLTNLMSLTPLQHHISVIYTSSFFHLFGEDEQFKLAHLFASLLSPLPGSIIFGSHNGASDTKGDKPRRTGLTTGDKFIFAHSPASWKELWTDKNGPFSPEQVSVRVEVIIAERKDIDTAGMFILEQPYIAYRHIWSVTRR
ncbi:hypothetical protein Clacol_004063 [Clathrus columnatus]|uniref:Uncharacterized protein n=1 Tax=Clathrus columnatus TaxID=1419009 RepID=A0AAV5A5E6_9AGAM|nr:hypothetical protein Clacol_004063 [Clathrus columnatus]